MQTERDVIAVPFVWHEFIGKQANTARLSANEVNNDVKVKAAACDTLEKERASRRWMRGEMPTYVLKAVS